MLYTTYPYGHDFGNSNTAGVTSMNGQTHALLMPSAKAEGTMEKLTRNVSLQSLYGSTLTPTSHVVEVNGNSYYVGDLAIQQNATTPINRLTARGDISRYWSEHNLIMLLATSATLINDREYGLAVVDNLPISTMENPENAKRVKASLDGDYVFTLDGHERIAHITVKKTVMEGAGANLYCGATAKEKAGIIDIGGRTTDAYMVTGQTANTDQCESEDTGVETAIDEIKKAFITQYNWPLSHADAQAMMKAFISHKRYDLIASISNSGANPLEVDILVDKVLRATGKRIFNFVKQIWRSSLSADAVASDAKRIILVGGGAYYFEEDLKPLFRQTIIVPEQPEFANAAGYLKLAQHYLSRELKAARIS
jgi:hypothetical protein